MADVERHVETRFTIADRATGALNKMGTAATRITGIFDKASSIVGKFGGIAAAAAGGFAVASSITGAKDYLRTVRDISDATGFAAEEVDGMMESMFFANIEAQEAQNVIMQMSVAMARYRMEVERVGKAQSEGSRIIERMGVSMKMGPQAIMMRMAKLAQQQKLQMADLVIGFQLERRAAAGLFRLLQEGPEHIAGIMEGLRKRGIAVTAENVQAFAKFEQAQLSIKSAWDRIFIVMAGRVIPALSGFLEKAAARIDSWAESAAWFGEVLAEWLGKHLDTVIMIGKVMMANFALQKTMGIGLGGMLARGGGMLRGAVGMGGGAAAKIAAEAGAAAAVRATGYGVMKAAARPALDFAAYGKPVSLMRRIAKLFTSAAPGMLRFGSILFRFTAVGAVITAIIAMTVWTYQAISKNVLGIRDLMVDIWTQIQARVGAIWDILSPLFTRIGSLFSTEGVVGHFFARVLVTVVDFLGQSIDNMLRALQTIMLVIEAMSENFYQAVTNPIKTFQDAWEKANLLTVQKRQQMEQAAIEEQRRRRRIPEARQPPTVMDFRGSKFDIKQQFAEGFDPDRIAVAFSNDLAALGERRVQSGLAPLYAVR